MWASIKRCGRDRLGRAFVQRLQQRQRALGVSARTFDPERRLAAADAHRQRRLDRPQVRVERAAQVGQAGVVGGLEGVVKDHGRQRGEALDKAR